ncbi:hypothetical protein FKM82_002751 [Ascaphus truei]
MSSSDVFLPEGNTIPKNQLLLELPSYQSMLRSRTSTIGTREKRKSSARNFKASFAADLNSFEAEDLNIPLRHHAVSIQDKRKIRHLQILRSQYTSGWSQWRESSWNSWRKLKEDIAELFSYLQLWRQDIHSIEGKFGTGIRSYFSFLRFLVCLNFVIFLLMFTFVTLPIAISRHGVFNSSHVVASNAEPECTHYSPTSQGLIYFYSNIIDLLSGTGFLELTYLFYGYYTVESVTFRKFNYSVPLAYLLVTLSYLLLSIIWIVKRAVEGFKRSLVHNEDRFQSYCNKIFAGWDFCITDEYNAHLKHSSLQYEIKADLAEERIRQKIEKRTQGESIRIYCLRIFLNIIVIAVLGGCFYAIYLATVFSQKYSNDGTMHGTDTINLLVEYLPSIVITIANFVTPLIFETIVRYEDYSPAFEIRFTLIRYRSRFGLCDLF